MSASSLREPLLALLRAHPSTPRTKSELARLLRVPSDQRGEFRATLQALVSEGLVVEGKKARYLLRGPERSTGLTGTLKFLPRGQAMFFPEVGDAAKPDAPRRIIISRRDTGTALDGDRVLVTLLQRKPARNKRRVLHGKRGPIPLEEPEEPTGRVEKVLVRRSGKLVGIFHKQKNFAWVESDDKALADSHIDIVGDSTAQPGQLVVVSLDDWSDASAPPRGRVVEVLGWPGDPGADMLSIVHRFGLRTTFPDDVLAAARAVPEAPEPDEIARRRDWRDKLVITIDPADAKDHDDAIWVEKHGDHWRLAVHIADVSHYIKPDHPMDREALERGNSTYLADRVLPMLPVELSNGICSLKPDVDRLTKCALLDISTTGEISRARFVDAVIHSRAKLSYEQAQAILDGKPAPDGSDPALVPMVREAWQMASTLRQRRFANGALDLEMPEVKIRLDEQGRAVAADPVVHSESHQLIEECMLVANEAVARILRERMKPAIYRVHEDPDAAKLADFTDTASLHGYRPGDLTNRVHIQKLLDAAKGRPDEHIIKLGLLKSLKRAAYGAEPLGHYGLSKGDYTHFTSPIRRYADLIVHRALQPLLENPPTNPDPTPPQAALREIARHISETERTSAEAESESRMVKLFEYLAVLAEKHDPHVFHGIITEARPMGLMVEVPNMGLRGVVKREDLPSDHRWRFEASRVAWVSMQHMVLQGGMAVPLHVVALDAERRFVDFALAGPPEGKAPPPLKTIHLPVPQKHHGKPAKPKGRRPKPAPAKPLPKKRGKR